MSNNEKRIANSSLSILKNVINLFKKHFDKFCLMCDERRCKTLFSALDRYGFDACVTDIVRKTHYDNVVYIVE